MVTEFPQLLEKVSADSLNNFTSLRRKIITNNSYNNYLFSSLGDWHVVTTVYHFLSLGIRKWMFSNTIFSVFCLFWHSMINILCLFNLIII